MRQEIIEDIRTARTLLDTAWPDSDDISVERRHAEALVKLSIFPNILSLVRDERQIEPEPEPSDLEVIRETVEDTRSWLNRVSNQLAGVYLLLLRIHGKPEDLVDINRWLDELAKMRDGNKEQGG